MALATCAWFALGIRQAHEVDAATNIITAGHRPSPPQLAAAAGHLRAGGFLNPDREVDILRGRLAILQGRLAQARRILSEVTRAEPMNLEAWIWYTGASLGVPRLARLGTARIAALDPVDARAVRR